MRATLAVCLLLAFSEQLVAADAPPNTLTAKEIAEGWVLLFDGETTLGWKAIENGDAHKADLSVKSGSLAIKGNPGKLSKQSDEKPRMLAVESTTGWPAFELVGEYRMLGNGIDLSLSIETDGVKAKHEYHLRAKGEEWQPLLVRLMTEAPEIRIAGELMQRVPAVDPGKPKLIRLGWSVPASSDAVVQLRNLKLRPMSLSPLFNGKNLDGWSINKSDPKRVSSQWTVTKEGELSLKNGPGDLFSDREFDNFVLQAECKTLGTGLNSGIFFRCVPGQYQNGYEAQIHNLYKDNDRTKPVDFGTGAIYRRVPARKVVSNDNEWFTMTLAAEGNHIATWVNGYQTVDWTDTRPADENPRKGYRAARGPVSLQGHDPTTNLLFKNIRIVELLDEKKK